MPPKTSRSKQPRRTRATSDSDESYHSDGSTQAARTKKPEPPRPLVAQCPTKPDGPSDLEKEHNVDHSENSQSRDEGMISKSQ
ncbi:hypothetical protein RSOLAG1IB_11609 [Rhizoctonia solani AG-1 IB]|uniref:Uncharacterized protein n=1 Tax=Thanatephorus cucumeris (strain AG1-IB / isolate 7/3/14) TaxID=1108050 RepID=A0A0B7F835_THACB|nr:hypothetical protein RSOLAG1IB_11609 [Rhizoctonia solani AG-1 IB]